ncbi:nucleoside transporter [Nitzschia inconspicua]|uniref:Nucleoside transporter n=1 Tax=Nitzschia inconspicua TaxID=303405 RepID=A0A9K3LFM3_9STRA|nr:nucleoside transporter [Nitzschia inconspicua]
MESNDMTAEEEENANHQGTDFPVPASVIPALHLSDGMIRAIFLLLGVGILLPWNAFVSSKPYFAARLCGDDGEDIVNFEQYFGLVWNFSSVVSLGLIIAGQAISDHFKRVRSLSRGDISANPLNRAAHGNTPQNSELESRTSTRSGGLDHSFFLVMLPLSIYMAVFSMQAVLVLVPKMSPEKFLVLTLCGLAVCGTCGAIATAGIVSAAGLFPPNIGINPFFSGQALGGVAVSMANFVAATVEDPSSYFEQHCATPNGTLVTSVDLERIGTLVARLDYEAQSIGEDGGNHSCSPYQVLDWAVFSYFVAGCIVLVLCLVGFHLIHTYQIQRVREDFEMVHDTQPVVPNEPEADEVSPSISLELNDRINTGSLEHEGTVGGYKDHPSVVSSTLRDERAPPTSADQLSGSISVDDPTSSSNHCLRRVCESAEELANDNALDEFVEEYTDESDEIAVLSAIKGPVTCIFLTFTVTLCLFPSWVSELRSIHECKNHFRLSNDLYVPFSFLFFNVGDLLGRMLAERIPVERVRQLSRKLVVGALMRVFFFPMFLLCLSTVGSQSNFILRSDIYSLTVQFLFAVTNGVLVSTSFMWSPHLIGNTSHMQERASEIMTFAVCFGLLSGSLLAFPFLQVASLILQ